MTKFQYGLAVGPDREHLGKLKDFTILSLKRNSSQNGLSTYISGALCQALNTCLSISISWFRFWSDKCLYVSSGQTILPPVHWP